MAAMRFIKLLVWLSFAVYGMMSCSSAHGHDHQDWEDKKHAHVATGENAVSTQKKLLEDYTSSSTWKMGLGGRKMAANNALMRKETKHQQGLHREDIPAKGKKAPEQKSLGGLQEQFNTQRNMKTTWGTRTTGPEFSQDSKAFPAKACLKQHPSRSDHQKPQEEETERLLEATKEIVNLMHRDYSARTKPRRKPPINNRAPLH